jgi:hypothetical protein
MDGKEKIEFIVPTERIGTASMLVYEGRHYGYSTIAADQFGTYALFREANDKAIVELTEKEFVRRTP